MSSLPLKFQIFTELIAQDGLLIIGRGLGLDSWIMPAFIRLHCRPESLVLLVNCPPMLTQHYYEQMLSKKEQEEEEDSEPSVTHFHLMDSSNHLSTERSKIYLKGGVCCISSRMLIVDMLNDRLPFNLITGLLISNAHTIVENSNEAFIIRLFRERNKEGFIKAFSDNPEAFVSGFAQLEKSLRILHLKTVHLWPRYHMLIANDIEEHNIDLVEYHQPLTNSMEIIQRSIVEVMDACLQELCKSNTSVETEELTVEKALLKSFDSRVRSLLSPIWYRIGSKTKNLLNDIRLLRRLTEYLLQYDCVSFNKFLETVITRECVDFKTSQKGSGAPSIGSSWMTLDAADTIFKTAKARVYKKSDRPGEEIEPVLENNPKWELVESILEEIRQDDLDGENTGNQSTKPLVLIMVADYLTAWQVHEYLLSKNDKNDFIKRVWAEYRAWNRRLNQSFNRYSSAENTEAATPVNPPPESLSEQYAQHPPKRLRRKRGGGNIAASTAASRDLKAVETMNGLHNNLVIENTDAAPESSTNEEDNFGEESTAEDRTHRFSINELNKTVYLESLGISVKIQPYEKSVSAADEQLLYTETPKYVIIYDPKPSFVRSLEVYKAINAGHQLRVYFLFYETSIEEQRYLTLIRREKEAFERLIRSKATMAVQLEQDGRSASAFALPPILSSSRLGGGSIAVTRGSIIVDVREFRAQLPFVLHTKGFKVIPLTIEIGDYVLTPDICVERKSISDLIQSFNSGRLYSQVEMMTKYYKTPVLLIEFDAEKSFTLHSQVELSNYSETQHTSIMSKIVALTVKFPQLRLIWSRTPHSTAEIFLDLKSNQKDPDPDTILSYGMESLLMDEDKRREMIYNFVPVEMIQRIPGFAGNRAYIPVIKRVKNLANLSKMKADEIDAIIGNPSIAEQVEQFFQ